MTPEEVSVTNVLAMLLYLARRGRGYAAPPSRHGDFYENFYHVRRDLLTTMRRLGVAGRARVSLKVWHSVWWILPYLRLNKFEEGMDAGQNKMLLRIFVGACERAMAEPRLATARERQTLQEQLEGRMTAEINANKYWDF